MLAPSTASSETLFGAAETRAGLAPPETDLPLRDRECSSPLRVKHGHSRGERVGRVSSEWFSRPADERYLSLANLFASVKGRSERSRTRTVESAAVRVEASRDDAERPR